jgi:hypothetical protein
MILFNRKHFKFTNSLKILALYTIVEASARYDQGNNSSYLSNGSTIFLFSLVTFNNFWLTIQNTANRHVSNAFELIAVFISFPLARAAAAAAVAADFRSCCCWAPPPNPAPFIFGEGSTKK